LAACSETTPFGMPPSFTFECPETAAVDEADGTALVIADAIDRFNVLWGMPQHKTSAAGSDWTARELSKTRCPFRYSESQRHDRVQYCSNIATAISYTCCLQRPAGGTNTQLLLDAANEMQMW